MDLIHSLALGFAVACTLPNLLCAFCGALLGTLVGVLPGIGSVAAIALLLPAIHALDASAALIMLAAVYYGAQYGGSSAAILVNAAGDLTPGLSGVDGYQLARQGRAGAVLAVAALGSFFAGCVAIGVIAALAAPLAQLLLRLGPAEYFSLMVLGLVGSVVLASGSLLKGLAMVIVGLLLSRTGADATAVAARYGLAMPELTGGIGLSALAIGLLVCGEIIVRLGMPAGRREVYRGRVGRLWPSRADFHAAWPALLRGTALGSVLGALPGSGATLSSFASRALEKKLAGAAENFGKGDIRGVGGPESANNAGAQAAFMPTLALGIPPNAVMALLLGALLIKGVQPGPQLMTSQAALFWGLIASMWLGNLMLVALNLPLASLWVRLVALPYRFVFPAVTLLASIGVYTLHNRPFEVYLIAFTAVASYVFHKLGCQTAPLLLGFVLGPLMESNLRHALESSHGDWSALVTRPVSATLLAAAALLVSSVLLPSIRRSREATFVED